MGINRKFIITAAHCFQGRGLSMNPTDYEVRVGFVDFCKSAKPRGEAFEISRIKVHEKYDAEKYDLDIALLTLKSEIRKYSQYVRPICLKLEKGWTPSSTDHCTVTGWGALKELGKAATILQEAKVPIISTDKCKKAYEDRIKYGDYINKNKLCAGFIEGKVDSCQGDSGGPLTCRTTGKHQHFLGGIVSSGWGCARKGVFGVYTRYTQFIDWIKKNTKA